MPLYIKEQGGGRPTLLARQEEVLVGVGFLPFLLLLGGGKEGREREGKGGAAPSPSPFGQRGGARCLP